MKIITHRNQESDWCAGISWYSDSNTDMRVKTCEVRHANHYTNFMYFPTASKMRHMAFLSTTPTALSNVA